MVDPPGSSHHLPEDRSVKDRPFNNLSFLRKRLGTTVDVENPHVFALLDELTNQMTTDKSRSSGNK
jgi:hypothetical protein